MRSLPFQKIKVYNTEFGSILLAQPSIMDNRELTTLGTTIAVAVPFYIYTQSWKAVANL